ncbi:MAG: diguanylate cyclase, partial [Proteobacteria bacterium]|nr:diguanylate cyclase [Pseudomonadota bacterium]
MVEPRVPRILLVDDEESNLKALERTLRDQFEVVSFTSPKKALDILKSESFSVVVADQRMPEMLGTQFLSEVQKMNPFISRIILTAHTETQEILESINRAGIFRYITKPWENQELVLTIQQGVDHHQLIVQNKNLITELEAKTEKLQQKEKELLSLNRNLESMVENRTLELKLANERLSELAMTDPLTKILNRRAFSKRLIDEIDRSNRYKHSIVIALIDVDHFKHFNDTEGHVLGDEALKKIAQVFSGNLRKSDCLARYGGEEFIIMMPETKLTSGSEICERLRSAVEALSFQGQQRAAYLTVSIGLCEFPESGDGPEELINAAD